MGRRFGDIRRANELETALTNYKQWIDESFTDSKRSTGGTVGPTRKRAPVFIKPFGSTADTPFKASRSNTSTTKLGTVQGRVELEPPGENGAFFAFQKGQKPCRVHLFESNGTRSYVRSKITQLFYLKYEGENYSTPIGRLTANEREPVGVAAAFSFLRQQAGAADYVRVWHSPEDIIASRM